MSALPARHVASPIDAVEVLRKCSVVVGMHPDQVWKVVG
jgi:hypothetical protein